MKQHTHSGPGLLGAGSLLTIFSVLTLAVLALLTLTTAHREDALSRANADSVAAWYEADLEAEMIFSQIRAKDGIEGEIIQYSVEISPHQVLQVEVLFTGGQWHIHRRQAVSTPPEGTTDLPIWPGVPPVSIS